jgi:hypothetical protein
MDELARLATIESRLGAVEKRMDIWNERLARIEIRLQLREEAQS